MQPHRPGLSCLVPFSQHVAEIQLPTLSANHCRSLALRADREILHTQSLWWAAELAGWKRGFLWGRSVWSGVSIVCNVSVSSSIQTWRTIFTQSELASWPQMSHLATRKCEHILHWGEIPLYWCVWRKKKNTSWECNLYWRSFTVFYCNV